MRSNSQRKTGQRANRKSQGKEQASNKSLVMRIIVIAMVAVMFLGFILLPLF